LSETMWSLTSTCAKRIGGPKKFRPSGEKDFFNTICQQETSLDHSIGEREQLRCNFKPKCLGSLEVDNQFEFC